MSDERLTEQVMLACNCATTPPTMPTCRDKHLPSCPQSFRDTLVLMLTQTPSPEAMKPLALRPPPHHGRRAPEVAGAVFGAEKITLRAVITLWDTLTGSEVISPNATAVDA